LKKRGSSCSNTNSGSQSKNDTAIEFSKGNRQDSKKKEIDDLIQQLNQMKISDPNYGVTYYRAIVLDQRLTKCLKAPLVDPRPRLKPQSSTQFREKSDPQQSSWNSNKQKKPVSFNSNYMDNDRCYGCGGLGHRISGCQRAIELLNAGVVKRQVDSGNLLMHDGSYIKREPGETLLEAAVRISGYEPVPSTNLFFISPRNQFDDPSQYSEFDEISDEDSEDSDLISIIEDYYDNSEEIDEEYGSDEIEEEIYKSDSEETDAEPEEPDDDVEEHPGIDPRLLRSLTYQSPGIYAVERSDRVTRSARKAVQESPKDIP
jgi:hypothetical protein